MLDALLQGQATPEQLARLAQKSQKQNPSGYRRPGRTQVGPHHRKMIRCSLERLQFPEEQIVKPDDKIGSKFERAN